MPAPQACVGSMQQPHLPSKSPDLSQRATLSSSRPPIYFELSGMSTLNPTSPGPPVNFHSVMDRPERVRRVMPPSTTMLYTHTAVPPSHTDICLRAESLKPWHRASEPTRADCGETWDGSGKFRCWGWTRLRSGCQGKGAGERVAVKQRTFLTRISIVSCKGPHCAHTSTVSLASYWLLTLLALCSVAPTVAAAVLSADLAAAPIATNALLLPLVDAGPGRMRRSVRQ